MRPFLLLALLAGCGGGESEKAPPARNEARAEVPAQPQHVPTPAEIADMEAAAATLRLYYEHIGRRDYRAAWVLRERRPGLAFETFARSFDRYESYHADVGTPSFPAEADGFVWIDAPVQIWGRQKDGRRFGNVGRVMLKRRAGTDEWQVAP